MLLIKKIILLIIFISFGYLLFKLIRKRQQIRSAMAEGFFGSHTQQTELNSVNQNNNEPASIVSVVKTNLPLKEYFIKAAYNSALSGDFMNTEMIKYVLSRGCRFLDLEVFSIDNIPYVAYSTDSTFLDIDSKNKLQLSEVLKTIAGYGFMSPSPNPNDPIFIHFRIKSKDPELYKQIAMSIDLNLKTRLYKDERTGSIMVNGQTKLSKLMKKIIIVVDKSTAPNYKKYPECDLEPCYNLSRYVNMESGGDTIRSYKYDRIINQQTTPPHIRDNGLSTDISDLKMVFPDAGNDIIGALRNYGSNDLVLDYGVQIAFYRFYQIDTNLIEYEKLFSDNKSAFIPMSQLINYIKTKEDLE
jgi:hypothetical protein